MRVNEKMRKALSILLCLCMLLQNAPVMAFAATTDNLCEHHTEHTAECGYREGSAGSACTHEHSEDCYAILECLHTCGEECADGCTHECTVENGCITMELDCRHVHGDCGYSEGTAEVPCGHVHDETCGYVEVVYEVLCDCTETDEGGNLIHTEGCGYVAPVEGVACGHTEHTDCGYAPATEGTPCTHVCEVKVDSDDSCYKLLCSHKDGGHDDACGYAASVSGSVCTYHCHICRVQELVDALPGEVTAENAEAVAAQLTAIDNEKASLSDEELAQVDFAKYTAAAEGLGSVYAAVPAVDTTCNCETKCAEGSVNSGCAVCGAEGADLSVCTGTETTASGVDDWCVVNTEAGTVTIDGTLGGKTTATEEDINALLEAIKGYVDSGITTIIVTGGNPAVIEVNGVIMPAVSEAIYRLSKEESYNGKIDLILQDVTEIMEFEFYDAFALNSITLPNVMKLGDSAFFGCYYLEKMTFGLVLTEIQNTSNATFYWVGEEVGGCDLVLNCGQMQGATDYQPNIGTHTWCYTEFKSITLAHTGGEATCTVQAVCSVCGDSYGELADHTTENDVCTLCGAMKIVVSFDAGDYNWETGDQIKLSRQSTDDYGYPVYTNYHFTATVAEDGTVTWTPDKSLYSDGTGEHTLAVSYPNMDLFYQSFGIPGDQSTFEKLREADCMNAIWSGNPTTDPITLNLTHRLAKVTVDYEVPEGVAVSKAEIYTLTQYLLFDFNTLERCDIWEEGDDLWINSYRTDNQFTAFVSPDAYAADGNFIKITLSDGSVREVKMTKAVTFEEGKEYTYKLIITADGAYLTCEDECSFEYTDNGDGTHNKVCSECGYVAASDAHTTEKDENKANCQHGDICDLCGTSYGEVDKTNHDSSVEYENGFCEYGCYEPAVLNGNVYEISNAGQLYWFAAKVNSGNVDIDGKLMKDIQVNQNVLKTDGTLNGDGSNFRTWTPIGNSPNVYDGTFDGGSHTVSGLYFNNSEISSVGLFGDTDSTGNVRNVGVTDSYFKGKSYVGGVVGWNGGTVTGCYNTGTVSGEDNVGGVVGYNASRRSITNCYNTGAVSGSSNVGGVVGDNHSGTTTNCYNTGAVSGSSYVGGVVGNSFSGTITNCYNTGAVSGNKYVGGVVGYSTKTVTGCYNTGAVSGSSYVGGVVGYNASGTTTNCYNTGAVSGSSYVGGVAGCSTKTVTNCYYDKTVYTGRAIGSNSGTATKVEGKSTAQFASGEVAYLLSQGENGDLWGQDIDTDPAPIFSDAKVYYGYRSCGDTEKVYTNNANVFPEKPEHTQNPTYTDNHNGTHSAVYPCCGTTVTEDHTMDTATGKCACDYQFGFYVERDIEIDGLYHETYWFDNLSDALSYAHGSTDYGQYTTQSATVRLHRDLTIEEGETFSFQKQVVLDTNSFSVTNSGTLALEGYTYSTIPAAITGGTVTIGDKTYLWSSENEKWICAEGSHVTELEENKATCAKAAICDLCGTSYGELAAHNIQNNVCTECGFTYYNLWVGGVQVNSDNAENVLGDGTVHYDADTQTLTLSDADIRTADLSEKVPALKVPDGSITLVLTGENKLTGAENCPGILIESGASVTVAQDSAGSLDVQGQALGYLAQEKIYVNSSIAGDGDFTVSGGTVTGGIHMGGTITITGGTVNADFLAAENVVISGGTVTAAGQAKISYSDANAPVGTYGIYADKDIQISGGSVTVSGGYANITESYDLTKISTASATAAMYAGNAVTVTEGTVTATGGEWNGYYPNDLGFMENGGGYTEDGGGDVKNIIDKYGKALKAPSFTISDEASFTCGDSTAEHYSHSFAGATCSSSAVCAFCGTEDGKVDITNHDETVAYENGFCPYCDAFEPATDSDSNGYYDIDNAGKLYWFAAQVNSGYTYINGELKANIVVNENVLTADGEPNGDGSEFRLWTPIGTEGNAYTGTFDGGEYTISGMYFNDSTATYVGLFGYVGSGEVNHVGVIDSYFNGRGFVGGVVGCNNGTVEYAYNTGTVKGSDSVGGVVGFNCSTVKYAYNTGTVKCNYSYSVGGVVGYNHNQSTVKYAYNTGTVSGRFWVGGVVGVNLSTVKYAYNTGTVSGESGVGGVVGENYDTFATVTNCYFDSTVYTGNAIGTNEGTATNVEGKTTEQFAGGEVAYLLSQGENGSIWGQTIGTDPAPIFSDAKVYYGYTSCGDTEKVYTNNANVFPEKPEHTQNPTYTDNRDGTHSAVYPCCGTKGQPENHTLTYTANGSTITESCSANCGYSASLTLKAPANLVYDRTEKAATVEGEIIADYKITYSADAVIMAGDYTATLTVGDYSVSLDFTIAKADPDVATPSDLKATYGQTLAEVELPGGWAWKNSSASVGSVGSNTFAAIYTPANISNFNTLERDLTVVVAKAMPTVTAPVAADDLVYNGTARTLITAGTATGGTMQYSLDGSNWSETIPTGKDAKTYTVYYKVVGDSNHNDSSVDSVQVTIGKATLTVTADNKTMTTGQNLPTFTYTITGFVGGETEDVLTAKPTVSCEADGKTAGTYDITVSGAAADNYEITHVNGALSVVDHQHAWTYTAKDDTITATCNAEGCPDAEQSITISAAGKTYDGTPVTATLEGSIEGVDTPTITYSGNTNAGTHTASITIEGKTASVKFTIEKATVTVTADAKSKPYGTDNPTLTYTSEGLLGDDALTGALETTATKTSSVGEYDITVGSLANSNYTISFVGAKLTITKAAAPEIQWPTAAALTYGQKLSDSTLTSEDKNGTFAWQDGSIVPTVKNNGYVVVYTPKDTANYDYTGVELTETIPVTVSKAASSIVTAPKANTLTYTGEAQELITAGEAKGGTMQYQLNNGAWSDKIPTAKDEGTYTVSYKVIGDANHSDTAVKSLTVTIGDCTHSGNTNKDDADCTTQITCSVCGDVLVESKAHVWGDWTTTLEPTTTTEGSRERLCTNDGCEAKDTDSIPMLNEVEVPEEIVGGDVSVDNPTPATGEDVTITVTPDVGKEVDEVIVTGKDGKEIPVTDNGDGTYTYEQPDGDVTVEVVIKDTIYTVTWIVDGKTYKENQYKYGETITAPTDPIKAQSGCTTYTFDKWNGFTSGMTMPDNESLTFTAVFTEGESHIDENTDHICDRNCGKTDMGDHVDGNLDHVCDYGCDVAIGTCEDADKDHDCDYGCDKVYGTHEDTDKDHACDYGCSETIGTCEDADKDHDCDYGCDKVYGEHKDTAGDGDHVCDYGCGETLTDCVDVDTDTDHKCDECGAAMPKDGTQVEIPADDTGTITPGAPAEIDGKPIVIDWDGEIWLEDKDSKFLVTYKFNEDADPHKEYPTAMYAWLLKWDGESCKAIRVPELDNFMTYKGTSIRINHSSDGIRFFTAVPVDTLNQAMKGTLLTGELEGYKLVEMGTLYKWAATGTELTVANGAKSYVYGGSAGTTYRQFSKEGSLSWFTGMLTDLPGDAATLAKDILSRPYAIFENADGDQITLYGGSVQRSIYYVALQNKDTWASGTAYDNYVEKIIATVEAANS